MINQLLKIIPYISLVLIGVVSFKFAEYSTNSLYQSLLLNISASAFFVLIAYFLYERIKIWIYKNESKYLDSYIQRKIGYDIFATLYHLNKYVHGYGLKSERVNDIFNINEIDSKKIEQSLLNQSYLGFLVFKNFEDYKDLFKGALESNLILKYTQREKIILLLEIIDKIITIEHLFKNENSYKKKIKKSNQYIVQHGKDLNVKNAEASFILLEKTKVRDRFIVCDSGEIEQRYEKNMLDIYTLTEEAAKIISNEIYDLVSFMNNWLPEEMFLPKHSKKYRIIKDFYTPFTKIFTKKRKIYIGDIIENKLK